MARDFDCSANAVLLGCVAGALGAQLRALGHNPRSVEIRAVVPAPLRTARRAVLGNSFGLLSLSLPLGIATPVARAWEIHRRMEVLAGSHQALLTHALLAVIGLLRPDYQNTALDLLSSKATAVITTVPGPRATRFLAGARIDDMMFWVPQAGDIGLGVSILSYDGAFRVGVMSDANLLPQPQAVIEGVVAEFERLAPVARALGERQARDGSAR